jgi:hypothetical protein
MKRKHHAKKNTIPKKGKPSNAKGGRKSTKETGSRTSKGISKQIPNAKNKDVFHKGKTDKRNRDNDTKRRPAKAKVSGSTKAKTSEIVRKRGQNTIGFKLHGKTIESKIASFNATNADKHLTYFQTKDKPIKNKGYKPPKGVIIIVKGKPDQGELAFISPPDFVVNNTNVKAFTNGVLEKAVKDIYVSSDRGKFIGKKKKKYDASGEPIDPTDIKEVVIRYIY